MTATAADLARHLATLADAERPLSDDDRALLHAAARVLAAESDRHRSSVVESARVEREQLLRIQRAISERQPIMTVLDSILDSTVSLIPSAFVGLQMVEPGGETARLVGVVMEPGRVQRTPRTIRVGEGLAGTAIARDEFLIADDYLASPMRDAELVSIGVTTMMAAPVRRDSVAVGALVIASWEPGRRFSPDEQHLLQSLAEHASLACNDASALDAIQRSLDRAVFDATHDQLTGLANRKRAIERLGEAAADGVGTTVVFVDVDRFKAINDAHGHRAGDEVLREVARRLEDVTRVDDLVARLSGDEFLAIIATTDESAAGDMAARIAAALRFDLAVDRRTVHVSASVGCARLRDGETADDVVANADAAMYRAKQAGGGRMVRFDDAMREARRVELTLERDIRHAIDHDELFAHFQPIVDLDSGRVVGAEALARWQHPERGVLLPAQFVPAAEDAGLVGQIDAATLRAAVERIADWEREGRLAEDFGVSVNVSATQFQRPGFAGTVAAALGGLSPRRLWIEITETTMMRDVERSLATMRELRALGVRLAVDDFGTGWSSLAYLWQFPVSALKIDRSFVSRLCAGADDSAIVEATIRLAGALGLSVVAEGVESDEQAAILRSLGCATAQGFLISPPVDPEAFARRFLDSGGQYRNGSPASSRSAALTP